MENNLTNKTKSLSIFWWTIKRYIPVSIAYWILLMFSLPMIETFMAIVITAESNFKEYVETMKESAIYIAGTGFAGIAVFFSIIVAMIAFSYMHNKRSVDFFGSLPVSRRTMFFARLVAVIVITTVPVIIFGSIGACLSGSFAAAGSIMKVVGYIVLATIGNIVVIAFISLCCGSSVDIMISYAAINIAFPICVTIFNHLPSTVIPGMETSLWPASAYTLFCPVASVFTMAFGNGKVFGIIWWVVLTVVTIIASYVVCKKRKAEQAQNTYIFSAVEVVVKFIVCALSGLGLGWIMAYIGLAHRTITAQYIYFAIGLVAGIMVANILLHLVFHRGLVKFTKSLIQCGIVLAVCVVYTGVIATGMFGYDVDLPESAEIKGASLIDSEEYTFYVDGKNVFAKKSYDKETIDGIYEAHKKIIENNLETKKWSLYPITGIDAYKEYASANDYYGDTTITYELTDGTEFSRTYTSSELGVKIDNKLYTRTDNSDAINLIPSKYITYVFINSWESNDCINFELDNNKMEIIEALKKDIEIYGLISEKDAKYNIGIDFENERFDYANAYIYFNDTYVNTMAALKKYGYSNFKYWSFNSNNVLDEYNLYNISEGETIYFKLPEGMDPNKEVKCLQTYVDEGTYMFKISDKRTVCEHVKDDIWKYTMYDITNDEYYNDLRSAIVICQVDEDNMIDTGLIKFPKDEENNLLTIGERKLNKKGKPIDNDYWTPIYKYKWTKYEE